MLNLDDYDLNSKLRLSNIFLTLFILHAAGCASMELQPVGNVTVKKPLSEVFSFIQSKGKQCWSRETKLWKDGRVVGVDKTDNVIRVFNTASDIGNVIIARFSFSKSNDGSTIILVEEEGYLIGRHANLFSDIERWVSGDATCRD